MFRGTTPTNRFEVEVDLTEAEVIYITYKQGDKVLFEKTKQDIEVAPDSLTVVLTQQETLKLGGREVKIQIRARFPDGTAIASNVIRASVDEILKEGVI